ncbi:MAG: hypothetical protein WCR04_08580 [Fibrobacteraceae bacterium]
MKATGTEPDMASVVRNFRITAAGKQPVGSPDKFKRNARIRETSKHCAGTSERKECGLMAHESRAAVSGVQDE